MKLGNKSLVFYYIVFIALTLNFKINIVSSANAGFFNIFQFDSESLVAGRLILSERYNVFSHAGFLGRVEPIPAGKSLFWYQYEAYHAGWDFDSYEAYYSQPALQAFVYGILCKITGLYGYPALDFLKWLVSISTALIFTFFIIWIHRRWGWATALFSLVTILFSQWITVFGRNLFWVLGAFYLPFVAALWYLEKYEQRVKHPFRTTFGLMFSAMLLKCLLTGFEYITTTLIMSVTPWIFYAIYNRWEWKKFLKTGSIASSGVVTAVVSVIVWMAIQLSFVKGSLGEGFQYIVSSFGRRTYGSVGDFDSSYHESLNSNLWDVIVTYWNGNAFDLSQWSNHPLWQSFCRITFGNCVIFFLLVSIMVISSKTILQFPAFRRQQLALTTTLWVSLLAPLSWFVIFKGHSYIHPHMNHIVWHMPFMLLGAVLTGSTLWFLLRHEILRLRKKKDSTPKITQTTEIIHTKRKLFLWSGTGLLFIILIRLLVFEPVRVSGPSMENTLATGDWIIVNKVRYGARFPRCIADIPIVNILTWFKNIREADQKRRWTYRRMTGYADIQRNDVIVFTGSDGNQFVKRVVGLPGERLEIRAGKIRINDEPKDDPPWVISGLKNDTLLQMADGTLSNYGPVLIPEVRDNRREYFVLGDNRDNSMDSRNFGSISEEQIIGKASFILFPSKQNTGTKRYIFKIIQ